VVEPGRALPLICSVRATLMGAADETVQTGILPSRQPVQAAELPRSHH